MHARRVPPFTASKQSMVPMPMLFCTRRAQTEICQSIFHDLHQAGNIREQTMEQLYSEAAGKFLADRFVYGTCPKCGYEVSSGAGMSCNSQLFITMQHLLLDQAVDLVCANVHMH